jgi:4-hydroxy-4-methyl-2-oxoglutarate aldolase
MDEVKLKQLTEGLGVADVIDAMTQTFAHRAHIIGLDSPNPERVLFGPAATIGFMPVRKDLMDPQRHSLGPLFYRAIGDDDPTGKVLVMASNGHPDISLGGGTKLSRLRNREMAGLLCDGRIRDYEELQTYDFAVYCNGETVRAGGNEIQPYVADVPVTVGGVTVIPGDYVFASGNSAVIIPAPRVQEILTLGRQIMEKMDKVKESLVGEDPEQVLRQGSSEL